MIHTSTAAALFTRAAGATTAIGEYRNRARLGAVLMVRTHTVG